MKKFLSNIDNIIDDFEFQDVRFINNQFLKTMNREATAFLKENKTDNILVSIKINYLLGLINKLKLKIDCSLSFFTKALASAKEIENDIWLARIYSKLSLLSHTLLAKGFSSKSIITVKMIISLYRYF